MEAVRKKECLSIDGFKAFLNNSGDDWELWRAVLDMGTCWITRRGFPSHIKLVNILERMLCSRKCFHEHLLVQFWTPSKVGGLLYLKTSDQPFAVGGVSLDQRLCMFRKHCMHYHYLVEEGENSEKFGPIARVFTGGYPESSPDLRYYSTKEHPLRDEAVHCGFRGYAALPLFHSPGGRDCFCVMEFFYKWTEMHYYISEVESALWRGELSTCTDTFYRLSYEDKEIVTDESEEMFKCAIDALPELTLVQVCYPSFSYNHKEKMIFMQRIAFAPLDLYEDDYMRKHFIHASQTHNMQVMRPDTKGLVSSIIFEFSKLNLPKHK